MPSFELVTSFGAFHLLPSGQPMALAGSALDRLAKTFSVNPQSLREQFHRLRPVAQHVLDTTGVGPSQAGWDGACGAGRGAR